MLRGLQGLHVPAGDGKVRVGACLRVVIKAVDKILDNQNVDGGWAYNYNTKAGAQDVYKRQA